MSAISKLFPFLKWRRPDLKTLQRDGWAGISVALVLIPQAIAYATLAGMPPQTGLYAAFLPSIVGVLWGSSPLLAIGPVALTSLLVFGSLSGRTEPGSAEWVTLAVWLALYSGVIQLLLGVLKLGKISYLISMPVMTGFVNAAAVIIIVSQLPALIGLDTLGELVSVLLGETVSWTPVAMLFGVMALMGLVGLRRFWPRMPGIVLVTLLGIVASAAIDYSGYGAAIVGVVPNGLPPLNFPESIPFQTHLELLPAALIIALISFTEAMSSCRMLARKLKQEWNENQELIGQGLAKMTSAFSGAFPVSGSFSRSALNLYVGAQSPWSTVSTALCVLVCLLFLTEYLYYLPRSVLAAMIILPVVTLLDFSGLRRLFVISREDGAIAVATFTVTLLSAPRIYWGIAAGVMLTMVAYLYRRTHPRIIEVSVHSDGTLRDRDRLAIPPLAIDLLAVRIDSALNFLTAAELERFITMKRGLNRTIRRVLICAGSINDIDATGIDVLESLARSLEPDGVSIYFSSTKKQVWDVLARAGFVAAHGPDRFFRTDDEAVTFLRATTANPDGAH